MKVSVKMNVIFYLMQVKSDELLIMNYELNLIKISTIKQPKNK